MLEIIINQGFLYTWTSSSMYKEVHALYNVSYSGNGILLKISWFVCLKLHRLRLIRIAYANKNCIKSSDISSKLKIQNEQLDRNPYNVC
jgi:hypothetical protein